MTKPRQEPEPQAALALAPSAEEPEQGAETVDAGEGPMEVALVNLSLEGAPINVARHPETGDRVIVVGPVLLRVLLPMNAENARLIGRELAGGVELGSLSPQEKLAASKIIRR